MRFIDPCLGRIDDDEHLRRKISGFTVKNDAGNFDLIQHTPTACPVKMQAGEAVLAVDDEKSRFRILQIADGLVLAQRTEFEYFFGEEENAAGNRGLRLGGLVKIDDIADLAAAQHALKSFLAPLYRPDKLRDGIVRICFRFDCLAFKIKPAREFHAMQDVASLERNEVEDAVLLADSRCKHTDYLTRY